MILNKFSVGFGAEKKAGPGEARCVAGTAPALLLSSVRSHFTRKRVPIARRASSFLAFFSICVC